MSFQPIGLGPPLGPCLAPGYSFPLPHLLLDNWRASSTTGTFLDLERSNYSSQQPPSILLCFPSLLEMKAGEPPPPLYPASWQKATGSSSQLGPGLRRRASVAVPSPGWRLCLRWLFHLRQRGRPSADACHQLPSRLCFLVSPESSLAFRHMVLSPALAQPGSASLGSFHNPSPSLSIAPVSPWGLGSLTLPDRVPYYHVCHHTRLQKRGYILEGI